MPRTSASQSPITNVVVLMMENHSFDHMLGYLPGVGTLASDPQSLPDPTNPGEYITTYPWTQNSISPCPLHDHADVMAQLYGVDNWEQQPSNGVWPTPPMNGFLDDYYANDHADPQEVAQLMGNFTPSQLPALSMLATTYTVCTNWFCSVPGPTGPNRLFVNCASSGGYAGAYYQDTTMPQQLSTLPSVFDLINDAELTWGIYHEDPEFFPEGVLDVVKADSVAMTADPFFARFQSDVNAGTLPDYSFLTPSLPNSQHDSWDARVGDAVIALIYNTLYKSSYWEQTLLIITYDEHGGHFDPVPPPQGYTNVATGETVTVQNPDGKLWDADGGWSDYVAPPFDFTLLGVRVPAVIISAYTPAAIDDTVYEHASIPATLNALWGIGTLTKRDAVANSVLGNVGSTPRPASELGLAPQVVIEKP